MNSAQDKFVPLSVPSSSKKLFLDNLNVITNGGKKVVMLAADQRVEHTNSSFYGKGTSIDDLSPEHFFKIASISKVNLLATQFGLIDKYATSYKNINYIVKLNSITKFVKDSEGYVNSLPWLNLKYIKNIMDQTKVNIVGVGFTVFLGIKDESKMLKNAALIIKESHKIGLPVILWVYPKAFAYKNENDPLVVNTAASVGCCLGADIIKVNEPIKKSKDLAALVKNVVTSAGRTKVIISGGGSIEPHQFLEKSFNQVYKGGAYGVAVGRNIHQKSLDEAVNFCNALYEVVVNGTDPSFFKDDIKKVNSII